MSTMMTFGSEKSLNETEVRIGSAESTACETSNDTNQNTSTETLVTAADADPLNKLQIILLLGALSFAGFLHTLDTAILVTAVPVITAEFDTIADVGWYGSAYLVTLCACAPIIGNIYKYYNAKICFNIFFSIFLGGSLICGLAQTSAILIVGRAVAGIGGSGSLTGGLTIAATSLPRKIRETAIAILSAVSFLGSILAPILGGVLTEQVSWRWCFLINLPAGVFVFPIIIFVRFIDDKPTLDKLTVLGHINRLDPLGFALFSGSTIMVLMGLQWGGSVFAWDSSNIIGLFVGFVVVVPIFIFWEHKRGEKAMIPLVLLGQRMVYASCVTSVVQFGSHQIFGYYLPFWFQTILGVGPTKSGEIYLATAMTVIVSTLVTGVSAGKIGTPALWGIAGNAVATVGTGLMTTFKPSSPTVVWITFQIIAGLGRGMTFQQPIIAVQRTLSPSHLAVGTSLIVFFQYFGGAIFLASAQTILSSTLRPNLIKFAPTVNADAIFGIGATEIRDSVTSSQLPGVLSAYNQAIVNAYYLGFACSITAFLTSFGMTSRALARQESQK